MTDLPRPGGALRRFGWQQAALALLIAVLAYQVVVPFAMIIWTSLKQARPGEPDFLSFSFTLANYARAFGSAAFWRVSASTLSFVLAATVLASAIGAFMAWALTRANTPLAGLMGYLLIGRIVIPGILVAISWILVASPNIGLINQMSLKLFALRNPANVYTFSGMVFVQALDRRSKWCRSSTSCSALPSAPWTRGSRRLPP